MTPSTQPNAGEQLAALAKAELAKLEREDELDRRIVERSENGPMLSEPVWFVHRSQ
jgi:hypothetical protein